MTLTPKAAWRLDLHDVPASEAVTVELADASGAIVLRHTEGTFDRTPASEVRLGPTDETSAPPERESTSAILARGTADELNGRRLSALDAYRRGLTHDPSNASLLKAAGRLALALGWVESGNDAAISWLRAASASDPTDAELGYYLGVALAAAGRVADARPHLEAARRFRGTRVQATVQLSRLAALDGGSSRALALAQAVAAEAPDAVMAGALEVSLLRGLGRLPEAGQRVRHWRAVDPVSSLLRYESTLLGELDEDLWVHLGADANRVLDIADFYLASGLFVDAATLLARRYPSVAAPMREAGAVAPGESPLVALYRGYAREQAGQGGGDDYRLAETLSTAYVFPARRSSYRVLQSALDANPNAGRARYLLGALYLSSGLTEQAIESWQQVRPLQPAIPTLHRSLGLALMRGPGDFASARAVLNEGLEADPTNVEIYLALEQVLSALGAPAADRVAALRRYPAPAGMPGAMALKLAWALAETGEASAAERVFHDRFFPREEGGTSVAVAYAQTRLISARLAAETGRCAEALGEVDALAAAQPGLAFTAGGLGNLLAQPALSHQVAGVEWTCGRRRQARARWERLAGLGASRSPMNIAIASLARRSLGRADGPAERAILQAALADASTSLDTGVSGNPGVTEYARGLLLHALGRDAESRRSLRRVFLFPDRHLSHVLARAALHAGLQRGSQAATRSRSSR